MTSVRSYECSSCGGLVRATTRSCPHCHTPIATIRCANCFTMNVPEALHCVSCSSELGLMPVRLRRYANASCPRCRVRRLDAFSNGDTTLLDCKQCGGQFVTPADLAMMIDRHERRSSSPPRLLRKPAPFELGVDELPCPLCNMPMQRMSFGETSSVLVDWCSNHGAWFDMGELPRILAYANSGRLRAALERKIEKGHSLTDQQDVESRTPRNDAPGREDCGGASDGFDELEESVVNFVRWARRYFR